MSPTLLTHLITKPALLIAAGLVLLGAATGRGAPLAELGKPDAEPSCRAARQSLDALCRSLCASLSSDQESGFAHAALPAAFDAIGISRAPMTSVLGRPDVDGCHEPRRRLRQCPVGPSPPQVVCAGA